MCGLDDASDWPVDATDRAPGTPRVPACVALSFLRHLEALDVDAAAACFAPDGEQELPFAPDALPRRLDGVTALQWRYGGPDPVGLRFDVHAVRPLADPEWVLLEYHGCAEQRDGSRYENDYVGLFRVRDGLIVLLREYFDPLPFQRHFASSRGRTSPPWARPEPPTDPGRWARWIPASRVAPSSGH